MYCITLLLTFFTFGICQMCVHPKIPVQNTLKSLISNGCSKPAFIKVEGEEDFTYCCDAHDACYGICGMSKTFCDNDFKQCMKKLCDTTFGDSPKCSGAAETYAMGTMLFGQNGYDESQKEHCTCIPGENELQHYTTAVENFYATYAPDSMGKAAKALNKYASSSSPENEKKGTSRFNKMWYDLHKKYTNAISHTAERKEKKSVPKPSIKKEL